MLSRRPTNTLPSATTTPLLAPLRVSDSGRYRHLIAPVAASIASTLGRAVLTYITPLTTTGVPSMLPAAPFSSRWIDHAPPSRLMLDVLIWSSAEYRWLE